MMTRIHKTIIQPMKRKLFHDVQDIHLLIILSLSYTLILFFFVQGCYAGDSEAYMWVAQYLSGQRDYYGFNYRTIGYPLLMVVTGVTFFHTLWGLFIVQALMAAAIPIIIYKTIMSVCPKAAFFAALLAIVSLIPYAYMKAVLTEQSYIFFLILSIYIAVLYMKTESPWIFCLLVVSLSFLMVIHSSDKYLFIAFMFTFLLLKPRKCLRYVCGTAVLIAAGYLMYIPNHLGTREGQENLTDRTGDGLFYNVYLSSGLEQVGNEPPFRKENGPATTKLINLVDDFLDKNPNLEWSHWFMAGKEDPSYNYFFGRFKNDIDGLKKSFFSDPTSAYRALIEYFVAVSIPNPKEAEKLYIDVSIERLKVVPYFGLPCLIRQFESFFLSSGFYKDHINRSERWCESNLLSPIHGGGISDVMRNLTPRMLKQANYQSKSAFIGNLHKILTGGVNLGFWQPILFSAICLTFPFLILDKTTRPLFIMCMLIIAYQAVIVCMFAQPSPRHICPAFLIELMLAVTGVTLMHLWSNRGASLIRDDGKLRMNN